LGQQRRRWCCLWSRRVEIATPTPARVAPVRVAPVRAAQVPVQPAALARRQVVALARRQVVALAPRQVVAPAPRQVVTPSAAAPQLKPGELPE
jgi:hypothetical protein